MLRLDKYLCEQNIGSRSQVKDYIRQGVVMINGSIGNDPQQKIDPLKDLITFRGISYNYKKNHYYMLNKPMGVVSATQDNLHPTVIDLLAETNVKGLFPVGRLDKDTEGLLLITDDGELAHRLLSPKNHVNKVYYVETLNEVTIDQIDILTHGVDIGEKELTMPAKVEKLSADKLLLTIHEGKFHQVKRMLQGVSNTVTYLKRTQMGALMLDTSLSSGAYRELTLDEVHLLGKDY